MLDGLTGESILNKSIEQSVGVQSSPLTSNLDDKLMQIQMEAIFVVSFKDHGHDMFIYWMGECDESSRNSERKIDYDKSELIHRVSFALSSNSVISLSDAPSALLSHADLCKLRYQTTSYTALYGLTQSMTPPGIPIYHSSTTPTASGIEIKITDVSFRSVRRSRTKYNSSEYH